MPKTNCTITKNFLRELGRATNNCSVHTRCSEDCPIGRVASDSCTQFMAKNPELTIELIQKWSDTHPLKTRLDDLKEKYPNFRMDINNTYPTYYPHLFGYCSNCVSCINSTCFNKGNEICWNEPVEGGATGK